MPRRILLLALAALSSLAVGTMQLNCGGPAMPSSDWMGTSPIYVKGTLSPPLKYAVGAKIDAMDYHAVYKSHCFVTSGDLMVKIPVRMGKYTVKLLFAETYLGSGPGFRLFNVMVNNRKLMKPLDVYKSAGNRYNKGIVITFPAEERNGYIVVNLSRIPGKNNPFISGVIVEYADSRMNAVAAVP